MDLLSFKCPECGQYETTKLDSLRIHCQKKHSLPTRKLYALLFLSEGKEPTCACGCGEPTKFLTLQKGFSEYVLGHAARDLEFAKIAEKAYGSLEFKSRRSKVMKQQWQEGVISPLTGSAHPNWKGGTSALQPLVRSHLHSVWVYPKLKASGFRCIKCGSTDSLEVHHDCERFASILFKAVQELGEPGESFEKKHLIAEWVTNYHIEKNVSGMVLCNGCHDGEHSTID